MPLSHLPTGEAQKELETLMADSQHISVMLSDLYDAVDTGRPWSLVRLGDGELQALQGVHAPWKYCENWCATTADAGALRDRTVMAIGAADWVGWHQDPWLTQALTDVGLLPAVYERSQFGWCNLHMGIRRGFVERVLRNQPLFLVGEPMQRWLDEVLRPNGLGAQTEIWGGKTHPETMGEVLQIMEAARDSAARVVLASLGVWAPAVVDFARRSGKIGIDWGHTPDHNLKASCEAHRERWGDPIGPDARCPSHPVCQAHWRYKLNTCCEDSPEGTMKHYTHAGTAGQCLPE